MARKKKKLKKRNPEAQKLESPIFRQRIVPEKVKQKDSGPQIGEWDD